MTFYYEALEREEREKACLRLQEFWQRAVQDVLTRIQGDFGVRPKLNTKKMEYADCRLGHELTIPVTGIVRGEGIFDARREVTGSVVICSGRGMTEIFLFDKKMTCKGLAMNVRDTSSGFEEITRLVLAFEDPSRERMKKQLLAFYPQKKQGLAC